MKITQAVIDQSSSHDFSSEREISVSSESSFRTVFNHVSEITEPATSDKTGELARIALMLEGLIARMLEILTGKPATRSTDLRETLQTEMESDSTSSRPRTIVEITWKTERTERIHEQESTCFNSKGKIVTSDGKELNFSLSLDMKRNFQCERTEVESGTAKLCDPLVINFSGKSAELSGKRISFDLNADGQSESICALGSASGYLAIDRNGDGAINDGNELFGSRSGDGFADLAQLDSDGNHWLDEADAGYDKLLVWKKDGSGKESLNSLRETGVGALYLGAVETPFSLTDEENKLLAHIRASGIYLMENGQVGSLQQLDQAI
jgi:hypothetical protein